MADDERPEQDKPPAEKGRPQVRDMRGDFAWFNKPVLELVAQKRLTPIDFTVYCALCSYDGPGGVHPAVKKREGRPGGLAARTGFAPRTLYRSLRALEAIGLIRRHHRWDRKGTQQSSVYDLLQPPRNLGH